MTFLQQHAAKGQIVTGLLYVDREPEDLHAPSQHGGGAAQRARREGALPRLGGAREDQRRAALAALFACCAITRSAARVPGSIAVTAELQAVCGRYPALNGIVVRHFQSNWGR